MVWQQRNVLLSQGLESLGEAVEVVYGKSGSGSFRSGVEWL